MKHAATSKRSGIRVTLTTASISTRSNELQCEPLFSEKILLLRELQEGLNTGLNGTYIFFSTLQLSQLNTICPSYWAATKTVNTEP